MQRQGQRQQPPPRDIRSMSNREIENLLGRQYADLLKENKDVASIYRDCEEVVQGSLDLLDSYNRIMLSMKAKRFGSLLG